MPIQQWSFTRLWARAALMWAVGVGLAALTRFTRYDLFLLVPMLYFLFAPTFWAGEWAGSHKEIAAWPRERIQGMWLFAGLGLLFLGYAHLLYHPALLAAVAAPVAVLSWRWHEHQAGRKEIPSGRPERGPSRTMGSWRPPPPPEPPPLLPPGTQGPSTPIP